ncbi:VCBS repeat-containing protein [Streptomyces sp. NPDC052101]|uniref:FG-GAP repeat domain-containing protein n=1 Tax=Streptomyces sp. NPDC052101 TaxID=3155763 RepID=UPI0034308A5D
MHVIRGTFALVLSGSLVGALSAQAAAAPAVGTTAGVTVATDPVQPGVWAAATELAPTARHRVLDLQARADGALTALRDQPQDPTQSVEVRRLTVQVRPAGSTTWAAPRTLSTAADYLLDASTLAPQADGSFLAYWRERVPGGKILLKAATLAPGATRWSDPTTVATTEWMDCPPVVFGSATGRLTAVWASPVVGGRELRMTERPAPGEAWSEPAVFDTVKSGTEAGEWTLTGLHAAVDKAGNAAIAWNLDDAFRDGGFARATGAEVSYHSRIMEREAGATTWGAAEDLTPFAGTRPGALRLDADPAGGLTLLWASAGNGPVRFARKSAPGAAWSAPEQTPLTGWYAPRALPRPLTAPTGDVTLVDSARQGGGLHHPLGPHRHLGSRRTGRRPPSLRLRPLVRQLRHGRRRHRARGLGRVHRQRLVPVRLRIPHPWRLVGPEDPGHRHRQPDRGRRPHGRGHPPHRALVRQLRPRRPAVHRLRHQPPAPPRPRLRRRPPRRCARADWHHPDPVRRRGRGPPRAGSVHSGAVTADWPAGTRFTGFGDLNGDRLNDVLAVLPTGEARMYEAPAGRLPAPKSPYRKTGSDWRGYDVLTTPGDLTGDGRADLLARSAATGDIYLYAGNGSAGFAPRLKIRSGWKGTPG